MTLIAPCVALASRLSHDKDRLQIRLGLASSDPRAEILENLKQIGFEEALDLIISGQMI